MTRTDLLPTDPVETHTLPLREMIPSDRCYLTAVRRVDDMGRGVTVRVFPLDLDPYQPRGQR